MTEERKECVREELSTILGNIFTDFYERQEVIDEILDDVVSDIDETAGWDELDNDEYCISDIEYALARVLYKAVMRK